MRPLIFGTLVLGAFLARRAWGDDVHVGVGQVVLVAATFVATSAACYVIAGAARAHGRAGGETGR